MSLNVPTAATLRVFTCTCSGFTAVVTPCQRLTSCSLVKGLDLSVQQSVFSRPLLDMGAGKTPGEKRLVLHFGHESKTSKTCSLSHHEMLEEPGAHDVGGMFGKDPPLIFGLLVFAVQQGWQVQVHLYDRWWRERRIEKKGRKKKGDRCWSLVIVSTETKRG